MPAQERLHFGKCVIDQRTGEVFANGDVISLQTQPRKLLDLLLRHSGEVVTREHIREHIWGSHEYVDFEHSVNTSIVKVRRLLRHYAGPPFRIDTLVGQGYRLYGPVIRENASLLSAQDPAFLHGKLLFAQRSPQSLILAEKKFREALTAQPHSVETLAALAEVYRMLGVSECITVQSSYLRANASANAAIESDSSVAVSWIARGGVRSRFEWRWADGERDLLHAISLSPTRTEAYVTYGVALAAQGRFTESHTMLRKAVALSPSSPMIHVLDAQTLVAERHYSEAAQVLQAVLTAAPHFTLAHITYGLALLGLRDLPGGISHLRTAIEETQSQPLLLAYLVDALRRHDDHAESLKIERRVRRMNRDEIVSPSTMAFLAASGSRDEEAFDWLERCVALNDTAIALLRQAPCFDDIRNDVRFKAALQRLNVAD